jgi:hypothetical protein
MKRSILMFAAGTLFIGMSLTNCTSPSKKAENAQDSIALAKMNLDKTDPEYLADVEKYRYETAIRISDNNKIIIDCKNSLNQKKNEAKLDYNKKIAELEQRNIDMNKKLQNYKADGKENWKKFKTEFSHDMDKLGIALNDFTIKNIN